MLPRRSRNLDLSQKLLRKTRRALHSLWEMDSHVTGSVRAKRVNEVCLMNALQFFILEANPTLSSSLCPLFYFLSASSTLFFFCTANQLERQGLGEPDVVVAAFINSMSVTRCCQIRILEVLGTAEWTLYSPIDFLQASLWILSRILPWKCQKTRFNYHSLIFRKSRLGRFFCLLASGWPVFQKRWTAAFFAFCGKNIYF